jgi:thioredoxin reductase (NADPH)
MKNVDIAIIGAGPAGLSAAIYAARGGQKTVCFERALVGGQIILTAEIENYPGFEDVQSGFELIEKMRLQAVRFGSEFIESNIIEIKNVKSGGEKSEFILTTDEDTYIAKAVIIATGASPRKLEVAGETKFTGRGVSYCATCDGALYRNRVVAVVGGGDSAVEEAIFLTKFASKVYLIHRRDQLRAVHAVQQKAFKNEKIEFILDTVINEINGENQVKSLSLLNKKTNTSSELVIDGVFIYVGIIPNNELFKDMVTLDESGFIITDDLMQTEISGLYAAGDIRKKTLRQVVTATADGAIAAFEAEKYIN